MHSWIQTRFALVASNHYQNVFSSMEGVQNLFKNMFKKLFKSNVKGQKILLWLTPRISGYRAFQKQFSIMMPTADRVVAELGNDFT